MLREGYRYGAGFAVAAAIIAWLAGPWWSLPIVGVGIFMMAFFRDPHRDIPNDAGIAVSPADGKVINVLPKDGGGHRIAIFLSPLNVHVNRTPVSGKITKVEYSPGRFHAAWKEDASIENEQTRVTVATPN